jgi:hypothetical protein
LGERQYGRGALGRGEMSQDKSFFVSRTELLAWLNDLLQLDYKKVEDCASGACTLECLGARSCCHCLIGQTARVRASSGRIRALTLCGPLVQVLPTARSWIRSSQVRTITAAQLATPSSTRFMNACCCGNARRQGADVKG